MDCRNGIVSLDGRVQIGLSAVNTVRAGSNRTIS